MLTSILRALVKNPVKESFDITFMENEKSCQNINCFFFSFHIKTFFNWIVNQFVNMKATKKVSLLREREALIFTTIELIKLSTPFNWFPFLG